jgi:pimeloyl-ACP methyl ester carboxylesterase
MLTGAQDTVVPPDAVRALAELYPRTTVHVLPGVAHLRGLKTAPEDYSRAVLAFLDKVIG